MADTSKLQLVRDSALAAELTAEQIAVLAELVTVRDLAEGEILVDEGVSDDQSERAHQGRSRRGTRVHGRKAALRAALRATVPTRIFSLRREKLESLLGSEPLIVYRVMRAIFRVVHGILHRMALQATELTNYTYKQHGRY